MYFCTMKRLIPKYLVEADNLVLTVVITGLFSIAFLTMYTPFSDSAWFNLREADKFILTICTFSTGILLVVISKVLMYYRNLKSRLKVWEYILWNIAEIIIIATGYTAVTHTLIGNYSAILPKAVAVSTLLIVIPSAAIGLAAAKRDRNRILKVISSKDILSDELPKNDNDLVHITDNNGNLKLSLRIDNLLYIESQDNYIKVYYTSQDKLQSYLVRCKLKTIEESFKGGKLVRCHRSYILNTDKVKVLRKVQNTYVAELDHPGTTPIPVSKKYFELFTDSLKDSK